MWELRSRVRFPLQIFSGDHGRPLWKRVVEHTGTHWVPSVHLGLGSPGPKHANYSTGLGNPTEKNVWTWDPWVAQPSAHLWSNSYQTVAGRSLEMTKKFLENTTRLSRHKTLVLRLRVSHLSYEKMYEKSVSRIKPSWRRQDRGLVAWTCDSTRRECSRRRQDSVWKIIRTSTPNDWAPFSVIFTRTPRGGFSLLVDESLTESPFIVVLTFPCNAI